MGKRSPRISLIGLAWGAPLAAAFLALVPSCLDRRDHEDPNAVVGRCATCHGDPARAGDYLQRAAPPRDLLGETSPLFPGVGAHENHVYASSTHAAIACSECHVVPDAVDTPGHADDRRPAEVVLGPLASTGGRAPTYSATARRCADSWCHRESDALWTAPRTSKLACGTCHGLPPPAPHPPSDRCSVCHGEVVDADRQIIAPALHVDGKVEVVAAPCTTCHGSGDDPAPPKDTLGNTATSAIGVGAHQAHLAGGGSGRPLACGECHTVPEKVESPGHADALPAEVTLNGVAASNGRDPVWDHAATSCASSWCHGPSPASASSSSPSWIGPGKLDCTSCHGAPPAAPHPQIADCSRCHGEIVAEDDVTIIAKSRHVDGIVDVAVDKSCTACHGGANPAPPKDLSGSSSTTSPGVGAHQTHVLGTARSRPVPCGECHVVPENVLDAGHMDSPLPAELTFSGVALAYDAAPVYASGSCQTSACHGAVFPEGHASGGSSTTPLWTTVDGTQAACGTCHGIPPPAPHPKVEFNPVCSACHEDIAPDNATFVHPELHVDGLVTFTVP